MSTINVNQHPCNCSHVAWLAGHNNGMVKHSDTCASSPINIPCHLPRTTEFEVALGVCDCGHAAWVARGNISYQHDAKCPGRPIRVACSIGGETWAESYVTDLEPHHSNPGSPLIDVGATSPAGITVSARWALVKALVLGQSPATADREGLLVAAHYAGTLGTRDAVFAALADMARAEVAAMQAQQRVDKAFPYHRFHRVGGGDHRATPLSHARLAAYVEFLIEQVGSLL